MEKITARTNEKIKYAVSLLSASGRRENSEFLIEGARLCSDAAESGIHIVRAFFTADALLKYERYVSAISGVCGDCFEISDEAAARLSDTGTHQGVFAVCKMRENRTGFNYKGRYLLIENIQDPSNLGAVCRSAEALGLDGLVVSGGCDVYNPKALRSAMGSSFRIEIVRTDSPAQFIKKAGENGMLTLAAVPDAGAADVREISADGGVICCIGNEGSGLTQETIQACKSAVTIPMKGRAESLNASAAAAIIAWELMR